ncbi:MAG: hypothetical protein A2Y41_10660 [Spirochaetes bacterium GWB1_36_13]|nr:MAG: hypothetical protein A2Y41_10660 [Spirochaetes bacterium GWB1_36_13]
MKILGISGSPNQNGMTSALIQSALKGAEKKGASTKMVFLNSLAIKGCQACLYCRGHEGCSIKDDMREVYKKIGEADKIVIGSPIYMYHITAQTKLFIDRLFPYLKPDFTSKVNKETLFIYSQGNPDLQAHRKWIESNQEALKLLGFPVKEILIAGSGIEKEILTAQAEKMGEQLVY